ncbi:MAG: hypothetical protein M3R04_10375 [bacterium]|nr:hypothetical protein [bacterium]
MTGALLALLSVTVLAAVTDSFPSDGATPGANWTVTQGLLPVTSSVVKPNSGGAYAFAYYSGSAWGNDHSSQGELNTNGAGGSDMELTCRAQANGDHYMAMLNSGSGVMYIYSFVSASFTQLVNLGIDPGTATATWKFECSGASPTSLKIYKNGAQQGSTLTDSTSGLQSGGAPGIGGSTVTASWDDWEGTGESGGGGGSPRRLLLMGVGQ